MFEEYTLDMTSPNAPEYDGPAYDDLTVLLGNGFSLAFGADEEDDHVHHCSLWYKGDLVCHERETFDEFPAESEAILVGLATTILWTYWSYIRNHCVNGA